jgi:hypothetical protein
MDKLVIAKAKRVKDFGKQSRRKGKEKVVVAFGNGTHQT